MKLNRFFAAIALLFAFMGCENDPYRWQGETYARIVGPENWTLNSDSMNFSFLKLDPDATEFTVKAEIKMIGHSADYDRTVVLELDPVTTAKANMYSFEDTVIIPAGQVIAPCDITLFRLAELQESAYRIKINLTDKGSVGVGANEWNQLTIIFSDMLSKPSNWDEMLYEFFGEYSDVKYRFIIDVTGVSNFTYGESGGMSWAEMYNYQVTMSNALVEYNATHDSPLMDENDKLVTF